MAASIKYKCTHTHSKFIWHVLLTYNTYISSNTLSYFIYLSYSFSSFLIWIKIYMKTGNDQYVPFFSGD